MELCRHEWAGAQTDGRVGSRASLKRVISAVIFRRELPWTTERAPWSGTDDPGCAPPGQRIDVSQGKRLTKDARGSDSERVRRAASAARAATDLGRDRGPAAAAASRHPGMS